MHDLMIALMLGGAGLVLVAFVKLIDSYNEDWWVIRRPEEKE